MDVEKGYRQGREFGLINLMPNQALINGDYNLVSLF
jgi:hypothetical protein